MPPEIPRLTRTEEVFVKCWPVSLKRKSSGCDFEDDEGNLVEVKSQSLSAKQIREIVNNFGGEKEIILAHMSRNYILVFRLDDVIEIKDEFAEELKVHRDLREEIAEYQVHLKRLRETLNEEKKTLADIEAEGLRRCTEIRRELFKLRKRRVDRHGWKFDDGKGNHFCQEVENIRYRLESADQRG